MISRKSILLFSLDLLIDDLSLGLADESRPDEHDEFANHHADSARDEAKSNTQNDRENDEGESTLDTGEETVEPAAMVMVHMRSVVIRQCGVTGDFGKISETGETRLVVRVRWTHMMSVIVLPVHDLHALGLEKL